MPSVDGEEFDVKDEGGAAGDAGLGELSVAHFGRDIDFPSVADVHLLHGNNPSLDEVAQPARQGHVATGAVITLLGEGVALIASPSARTL